MIRDPHVIEIGEIVIEAEGFDRARSPALRRAIESAARTALATGGLAVSARVDAIAVRTGAGSSEQTIASAVAQGVAKTVRGQR